MSGSVVFVTTESTQPTMGARQRAATHGRARAWFYCGMSGVLLLIVLAGFGRTFYLRALFDVPHIPAYLLVHGAVLTAWFAGLFLQAVLVSVRRTSIHRRLGWVVGGVGLAVVAISGAVTLNFVPRQRALGVAIDAGLAGLSQVVWTDLAALVVFSVFLAAGVLLRRRPQWHKRLMLLASISIVSPAMGRMWRLVPVLNGLNSTLLTLGALLLLLVGLALYDVFSLRRVHPATLAGGAFFIGLRTFAAFVIANSDFGHSFVRGLG